MIVSDIHMPTSNGFDALRSLRRLDYAMPCVLMTAFGDEETRTQARACGAATVLFKPFNLDDLDTVIAAVVD